MSSVSCDLRRGYTSRRANQTEFIFIALGVSVAIINVFSCNTLQVARIEYFIVYFSPEWMEVKWVLHVVPNVKAEPGQNEAQCNKIYVFVV